VDLDHDDRCPAAEEVDENEAALHTEIDDCGLTIAE
jgi:hypothetical protein